MGIQPKRWLSKEEQQLWRAFIGAQSRLYKILNYDLETNAGFDHLTYEIFVNLSENENRSMRMTDLAKSVSANKSRLTYRVTQLEQDGLVKRVDAVEDGRGQVCMLTDKGFSILEKFAPMHVDGVLANFIEPISGEDVEHLTDVLNAIAPIDESVCKKVSQEDGC